MAPDLYYWGLRIRCLISTVRLGERPLSELDAARRWLAEQDRCTGSIGVVGFCMGGDFALMMAPRSGVSAASVNYGGATKEVELCPTRCLPDRRQLRREGSLAGNARCSRSPRVDATRGGGSSTSSIRISSPEPTPRAAPRVLVACAKCGSSSL